MTDPRQLLRRHGAPAPVAVQMQTEIRSGGGLYFTVLQAPRWSAGHTTPSIMQWSCKLETNSLYELWIFLRRPDPTTGLDPRPQSITCCGHRTSGSANFLAYTSMKVDRLILFA